MRRFREHGNETNDSLGGWLGITADALDLAGVFDRHGHCGEVDGDDIAVLLREREQRRCGVWLDLVLSSMNVLRKDNGAPDLEIPQLDRQAASGKQWLHICHVDRAPDMRDVRGIGRDYRNVTR
jgi:hypothetical protein